MPARSGPMKSVTDIVSRLEEAGFSFRWRPNSVRRLRTDGREHRFLVHLSETGDFVEGLVCQWPGSTKYCPEAILRLPPGGFAEAPVFVYRTMNVHFPTTGTGPKDEEHSRGTPASLLLLPMRLRDMDRREHSDFQSAHRNDILLAVIPAPGSAEPLRAAWLAPAQTAEQPERNG